MNRLKNSPLLIPSIVLGLLAVAIWGLAQEIQTAPDFLRKHWSYLVLFATNLILLLQILILFRKADKSNGTLILADLTDRGIPEIIYEVPEATVLQFCKEDFNMEYSLEYWPAYRIRLMDQMKPDTRKGNLAAKLYAKASEIASPDHVALLKYSAPLEYKETLYKIEELPGPADGAMAIIREKFPKVRIFRNTLELAAWIETVPQEIQLECRQKVLKFLKHRAKKIG